MGAKWRDREGSHVTGQSVHDECPVTDLEDPENLQCPITVLQCPVTENKATENALTSQRLNVCCEGEANRLQRRKTAVILRSILLAVRTTVQGRVAALLHGLLGGKGPLAESRSLQQRVVGRMSQGGVGVCEDQLPHHLQVALAIMG